MNLCKYQEKTNVIEFFPPSFSQDLNRSDILQPIIFRLYYSKSKIFACSLLL